MRKPPHYGGGLRCIMAAGSPIDHRVVCMRPKERMDVPCHVGARVVWVLVVVAARLRCVVPGLAFPLPSEKPSPQSVGRVLHVAVKGALARGTGTVVLVISWGLGQHP